MNAHEPVVIFEPLYSDVTVPARATLGFAGYDVRAHLRERIIEVALGSEITPVRITDKRVVLEPGARAVIPLGFRAMMPPSMEAQLRLRSSVAFRKGLIIPNSPATIDPDYPKEWLILVANALSEPVVVNHLERIAQIVFSRFETVRWQAGSPNFRSNRVGGLGSTGE